MGVPLHYLQVTEGTLRTNIINNPVNSGNVGGGVYYDFNLPEQVNSNSVAISSSNNTNTLTSIISDYFSNGLNPDFLQKHSRELTIAASSLSVILLIIIGACLWCLLGILKRGFNEKEEDENDSSSSPSKRNDDGGGDGTDDLDSSYYASDGSVKSAAKGKWGKSSEGKKLPIISKIFAKHNGNGSKLIGQHRNIITPDTHIPFVVPTISLPAQPPGLGRQGEDIIAYHDNPPSALADDSQLSATGRKQNILLAQQFFPQLEHPEDTCPLIAFSLFYELSSQILNVRLLEGRNFPESVNHTVAVKIYPGRSAKQNTKEFKTKSPVYNVEFCFHVRKSSLHTKILKLRAVIPGNPKRIIGYVNVALKDLPGFNIVNEEEIKEDLKTTHLWRRVELPSEVGDGVKLQVSLKWSPEPGPGLLTLKVIEAAGLAGNRECDYTSSYVKVTLQEQGRNIKTRKTQLARWGCFSFHDVFILTVPKELLSYISFTIVMIARGRLGSKETLGNINIGPVSASSAASASSSGSEFWEDMCHQPDTEIIRWLHLLP